MLYYEKNMLSLEGGTDEGDYCSEAGGIGCFL